MSSSIAMLPFQNKNSIKGSVRAYMAYVAMMQAIIIPLIWVRWSTVDRKTVIPIMIKIALPKTSPGTFHPNHSVLHVLFVFNRSPLRCAIAKLLVAMQMPLLHWEITINSDRNNPGYKAETIHLSAFKILAVVKDCRYLVLYSVFRTCIYCLILLTFSSISSAWNRFKIKLGTIHKVVVIDVMMSMHR